MIRFIGQVKERPLEMMDEKHSIFFCHIPKTGGSSIEIAHGFDPTKGRKPGGVPLRHHTDSMMRALLNDNGFEEPKIRFTIVRNIFDRICSTYRHLLRSNPKIDANEYDFESYVYEIERYFADYFRYEDDMELGPHLSGNRVALYPIHVFPLRYYLGENKEHYICLNFNNIENEYKEKISPFTQIFNIPHVNKTPNQYFEYKTKYNERMISVINEIYYEEIEEFEMRMH